MYQAYLTTNLVILCREYAADAADGRGEEGFVEDVNTALLIEGPRRGSGEGLREIAWSLLLSLVIQQ